MLFAGIVLFVLWQRGYLATWVAGATNALSGNVTPKPLTLSLAAPSTTSPTNGRYAGKKLPI